MKLRNVVGMLLLVGLLLGALWAADSFQPAVGPRIPVSLLNPFDKRDVSRVELATKDGDAIVLRRRTSGDDLWDVKLGDGFVRANDVIVDELLAALVQADVSEAFTGDDVNDAKRAEWGLADPLVQVSITLPGDDVRTGRFGSLSREGGRIYADRGPDTDVLVVSAGPFDEIRSAFTQGVRDPRLTDLRTYDVKKVTILRGGVATFEAEKDVAQIWKMRQPYSGYGEPTKMETRVSHLVNEKWLRVAEDGVQDLTGFGLDPPEAEVTLVSKRDQVRELLLGASTDLVAGGTFAMERGVPTVYVVSKRFADAVLADANDVRDRSFTRLGFDGVSLTVNLGTPDTTYKLSKIHSGWEIESPDRYPADGERVVEALALLREWHTARFHDGMTAAEAGIAESPHQIQIGTKGGGEVTLLIGRDLAVDGGRRYLAQRRGDSGVEEVLSGPIDLLSEGWLQFRRNTVAEWITEDIAFLGIAPGFSDSGKSVEESSWSRELQSEKPIWKMGVGKTGGLDAERMVSLLAWLRTIKAERWLSWDAGHNDAMGFSVDGSGAATLRLEVGFAEHLSPPAGGRTQILLIGKPHPDGGYYARLKTNSPGKWAFILSEAFVEELMKPLTRTR